MILGTVNIMQIIMLLVLVAFTGYYIRKAIKYFKHKSSKEDTLEQKTNQENKIQNESNQQAASKTKPKRSGRVTLVVIIIILLGLTLPFHYLPDHGKVLMKANLTFKNTIVTNSDIEAIVLRLNKASLMEQMQMRQDPFIQTLMESGVLFEKGMRR